MLLLVTLYRVCINFSVIWYMQGFLNLWVRRACAHSRDIELNTRTGISYLQAAMYNFANYIKDTNYEVLNSFPKIFDNSPNTIPKW